MKGASVDHGMEQEPKIYISYSIDELETAEHLYRDLENAGAKPWMYKHDLLPGDDWKLVIRKAINESDYVITLISSRSVSQRGFIHKEHKMALDLLDELPESKIFVIPVRVDDCEMPARLEKFHPTDLFPAYEPGFNKILKVFKAHTDTQRADEKKDTRETASQNETPPSTEPPKESPRESDTLESVPEKAEHSHETTGHKMPGWVLKVSIASALVFISSLLAISVFIPHPTTPELITPDQAPPQIVIQKIMGTILDKNGEPLVDVLVTLPEKGKETLTSRQGFFSFEIEAEKQAAVRIMAQKDGFQTYRKDIPMGTTGFSFIMERIQ